MSFTCSVAAIIALLGYMPPRGTVITVPKAAAAQYSPMQQRVAKRCAAKHGLVLRESE